MRDSGSEPGGMMRYGIPAYRLPRVVLDAEIDRLAALGVTFEQDHRVVDLQAERRGLRRGLRRDRRPPDQRVDIPNQDASRVVDAVSSCAAPRPGTRHP